MLFINNSSMKNKQETFASLMESFTYRYETRAVFDDFLTMSMCAVTQIPRAGKSHYEDLYLQTIASYAKDELRYNFPKLFAQLIFEMEKRATDTLGNDVLGEYFELNFCRKNSGQFFTPAPICEFMSKILVGDASTNSGNPIRVLDSCCGSGRMLLAASRNIGRGNEYYGIDIDHTCVKMTALNLFLNGVFHSEVMWADALLPEDFRMSYSISLLPLGIFRIEQKEESRLWHMHRNSFGKRKQAQPKMEVTLPSESGTTDFGRNVSQISLF